MAKNETASAPRHSPSHGVFVVDGEGEKAFWTRVGAAWAHQDGQGFNVALTAVPLSGRLVLRVRNEKEEQ
ncbi:MAG: hypothetical protein EOS55_18190 [Mesorhizobium sp.]|nr:MAG: hypothetical protein EOS55_18190 [Mesorhizobium sp.]